MDDHQSINILCARCVFLYLISFVILYPEQLEKPHLNIKTEEQLKTKNKNKKNL